MGVASAACQPERIVAAEVTVVEATACDFAGSSKAAVSSCRRGICAKDDTREVRDVHEFKAVAWKEQMTKQQVDQAQRVVDRTLQGLVLGKRVPIVRDAAVASGGANSDGGAQRRRTSMARISLTEDVRTLEIELEGDADVERSCRRVPLRHVVDASFGSGDRCLVLRFSDAMCMEPIELLFRDEQERLEVMLTLKVLRARGTLPTKAAKKP
eukprot:TRINITY_DN33075_c0_g1_i1.p1 TRINITY_DN33075_c0_g1~~TRINITY_DN33075_c0_g1_i1.p1  ORF type:complete len:241 (-),score=52.82 TRINITY_DN33075_c0_g1_i1:65-700(-)